MMWASLFLTAFSVTQQLGAASDQRKAAREAEALAQENARMSEAENEREMHLTKQAQDSVEGRQRALAAASGVGGASQTLALEDTEERHQGNLDWMAEASASRASIIRAGGEVALRQGLAQAASTTAGAWGTAAGGVKTWYNMR